MDYTLNRGLRRCRSYVCGVGRDMAVTNKLYIWATAFVRVTGTVVQGSLHSVGTMVDKLVDKIGQKIRL